MGSGEMFSVVMAATAKKAGIHLSNDRLKPLERWGLFQRLAAERRTQLLRGSLHEFRVGYSEAGTAKDRVVVALRVPFSDSSDAQVYEQIFVRQEYGQVLEWFLKMNPVGEIRSILDVGANIGCAALYFCHRFPRADIYCVEPEESNYARLELNIGINPGRNIRSLRAALSTAPGRLQLSDDFRDRKEWGARFVEIGPGRSAPARSQSVESIDIHELASKSAFDQVDLLKVDIEGGEAVLLEDDKFRQFLRDNVQRVAMEVHEEFVSVRRATQVLESLGFKTQAVAEFVCGIKPARTA
jgi:FkbM family methyltransferase